MGASSASECLSELEESRCGGCCKAGQAEVVDRGGAGDLVATLHGHADSVRSVAAVAQPSGAPLLGLTGSADQTAKVWDLASGRLLATLRGHGGAVRSVAALALPSGGPPQALTGSADWTARVWDLASGQVLATLRGHEGGIWSVAAVAPADGAVPWGLTGSEDRTARAWDLVSGEVLATLRGHSGSVHSVAAFVPPGSTPPQCLTGSADRTARVWDLESGEVLATLRGHEGTVWSVVAFAPPGGVPPRALTGSADCTARVWDLASGELLMTLRGHMDSVRSVAAFMLPGRQLQALTGSSDRTAQIWDLTSGEGLATLCGHEGIVWGVAALGPPHGAPPRGLTASADGTARVWRLGTFAVEQEAHAVVALARQAQEEELNQACTFYFVRAADVLACSPAKGGLPQFQELRREGRLVERTLKLENVVLAADSRAILAISHRWESPAHPDPSGVQLRAVQEHLRENPHFELVWLDWSCMPQGDRTPMEEAEFRRMLPRINAVFLGCSVLMLVDGSYLSRFWTQAEAWMAFHACTPTGLRGVAETSHCHRWAMTFLHSARPEFEGQKLEVTWRDAPVAKAHEILSAPDVTVTNPSDKEEQLPKILALDDLVRGAFDRMRREGEAKRLEAVRIQAEAAQLAARLEAEAARLPAEAEAEAARLRAEAEAEAARLLAEAVAKAARLPAEAAAEAARRREEAEAALRHAEEAAAQLEAESVRLEASMARSSSKRLVEEPAPGGNAAT